MSEQVRSLMAMTPQEMMMLFDRFIFFPLMLLVPLMLFLPILLYIFTSITNTVTTSIGIRPQTIQIERDDAGRIIGIYYL